MTILKIIVLVMMSGAFSFASQAAQTRNDTLTDRYTTGVISGSSTLISLEEQLAAKGATAETTSFRTTSISGNSNLYGTVNRYN